MTDDPQSCPPLDPEIAALLTRERGDSPFAASKERIARRLAVSAVAASLADPGGGPGRGMGAAGTAASGVASRLLRAALLLGVGAAVGATMQAHRDRQAASPSAQTVGDVGVTLAPPSRPEPPPPSTPTSDGTAAPHVPVIDVDSLPLAPAQASARSLVPSPGASTRVATSLGEEQRLLDTARTAVGRGAFTAALATLDEDEARFPKGHLLEERELLRVQALAGAGRDGEARAHAAQFEARYPGSIFLPAVREALDTRSR